MYAEGGKLDVVQEGKTVSIQGHVLTRSHVYSYTRKLRA